MKLLLGSTEVELFLGDITTLEVEAIVNAANNHLWMGGGVAGAIKRRGGVKIEKEAIRKGPIPVGEAVVTGAGDLKARYVIHAAVMGQDAKTDGKKIIEATQNSFLRAEELGIHSLAFPALGTGVGRFPQKECAKLMLSVLREYLEKKRGETSLTRVVFALFDLRAYEAFEKELQGIKDDQSGNLLPG